jgi:hypothetical protein
VERGHPVDTANRKRADQSSSEHRYNQTTGRGPRDDRSAVHHIGRAKYPMHPINITVFLVRDGLVASPAVPLSVVTPREGGIIRNLDHLQANGYCDMGETVTDRQLIIGAFQHPADQTVSTRQIFPAPDRSG